MIKELKPNYGDEYSWHEVNCFFRAWSIVLQSYHVSYFDNFLQAMFLNWTFFPESIAETEHDDFMLESNANVLSPLFNVQAEKVFYKNQYQFHELIRTSLNQKHRLIIPGDVFNIYYNAAYRTKHGEHYFILKGCDQQTGRYYILDNLHVKNGSSTLYEDFLIPWDVLYDSSQLFFENFQPTSEPYFWSTSELSPHHTNNSRLVFQANLYILNKYINQYKDHQFESMLSNQDSKAEQIQKFFMKFNHKNTYFKILKSVFKTLEIDTTTFDELIASFNELKSKIPIILAGSGSSSELFAQYTLLERNILLHMHGLITEYLNTAQSQENTVQQISLEEAVILNASGVNLQMEKEQITIHHSATLKTDTWIAENDAFQILWRDDKSNVGYESGDIDLIEVEIENRSDPGLPFQSGIIIVYDHETLLFGGIQNIGISLFVPQRQADYCVKEMKNLVPSLKLKIRKDREKGLLLYYKNPQDIEYRLFYENGFSPDFTEIGIFSRTWEPIDHTTVFTNLTVYNHNLIMKGRDEHVRI